MRVKVIFSVLSYLFLATSVTYASIPDRVTHIDISKITPVHPIQSGISGEVLNEYFPDRMTPTNNPTAIMTELQITLPQKVVDKFFNGDFFKKTEVGKITTKVEETVSPTVVLSNPSTNTVQQKIGFNVRAFDRVASLSYEGWFSTTLTWMQNSNLIYTTISKPLSDSTIIALSNTSPVGTIVPDSQVVITYSF